MSTARALAKSSFPILLDDLTFVGFGDCGWGVRRQGSSQGGSLIITADKRILGGFEATTTMVDWKSYTCKRVVCSSLAGETQAHVGTVDMLELTKVFYSLFLDPRKSLSDVEGVCTVLWREVNHQTGFWFSEEQPQRSLQSDTGWKHGFMYTGWANSDRQSADGLTKPQAAWKLLEIMSAGRWKVVWDATFQSARKIKLAERSEGKRDLDG